MLVQKTWIIKDETGFRFIFQTSINEFYISNSTPGRLDQISQDEAEKLMHKTLSEKDY